MTPVRLADDDPVRSGNDVVLSGVTVTGLNTVGNLCLLIKLLTPANNWPVWIPAARATFRGQADLPFRSDVTLFIKDQ